MALAAALSALLLFARNGFRAALPFAGLMAGAACVMLEIIGWRYQELFAAGIPQTQTQELDFLIPVWTGFWSIAGGTLIVFSIPALAHALVGRTVARWRLRLWRGFASAAAACGVLFVFGVGQEVSGAVSRIAIVVEIVYALGLIVVQGSPILRDYVAWVLPVCAGWSILVLPLVFLQLLSVELAGGIQQLGMPLYFLGLCVAAIVAAAKLFGRPAYAENEIPSDHFRKRFDISARESEIVTEALRGLSNQEIGEKLFISPKTVENHLASIYRKTKVKNRVQLYQLINAGSRSQSLTIPPRA